MDGAPGRSRDVPSSRRSSVSSVSSLSSTSTTSLILERINQGETYPARSSTESFDLEAGLGRTKERAQSISSDGSATSSLGPYGKKVPKPAERKVKRAVYTLGFVMIGGWVLALVLYLVREQGAPNKVDAAAEVQGLQDVPKASPKSTGRNITMDDIMMGTFRPRHESVQWIGGETGKEDGLFSTTGVGAEYLTVQSVKEGVEKKVLMKSRSVQAGTQNIWATKTWPSPDLKMVLIAADVESVWRHSFKATYWIYDVAKGIAEPLITQEENAQVQLAVWSPKSDSIAYVYKNNVYLRKLGSEKIEQITTDGGANLFNGIPDWVYEEEVFSGNSALWWSKDGKHITFLRTDESAVPVYPVQFFVSRPSGESAAPGLELYPETELIKYPKAGAPNPIVQLRYYDVEKKETIKIEVEKDFDDSERLITEITWTDDAQVLVRETNRESDILKVLLIDVPNRHGKVVRETDIQAIDGGWFEVTQDTAYVPADPKNGRPYDGYIDTVVYEGYNHLAYFTPMDNPDPVMLTTGDWEVVEAPSAVDLANNLVYFVSTAVSPIERHVYSVYLNGTGLTPLTDTSKPGRYSITFSSLASYSFLTYDGPDIPWQRIQGTPSGSDPEFVKYLQKNDELRAKLATFALPTYNYQNITVDGFTLQVVERLPPNFDPANKYPVLFQVYGGPGSQQVSRALSYDFQAFVTSHLNAIVITVDGRGTGFTGRRSRCIIRGNLGYYEARDQIAAAKLWASKPYVDADHIAIWGWSYGGFMTLKTLETDAGETFKFGMAVAPVTDWRLYDSIYTERYMHTPQHNPQGYDNATISDVKALAQNERFLIMHGVADDNVHFQNTLRLLDTLDMQSVENYDVHVFPDSDHSIYFHNANRMVYDRLTDWLSTAFSGGFRGRMGAPTAAQDRKERREARAVLEKRVVGEV